jgi:hypothetical protein
VRCGFGLQHRSASVSMVCHSHLRIQPVDQEGITNVGGHVAALTRWCSNGSRLEKGSNGPQKQNLPHPVAEMAGVELKPLTEAQCGLPGASEAIGVGSLPPPLRKLGCPIGAHEVGKIVCLCSGYEDDLEPLVALALALLDKGYPEACVIAFSDMQPYIEVPAIALQFPAHRPSGQSRPSLLCCVRPALAQHPP